MFSIPLPDFREQPFTARIRRFILSVFYVISVVVGLVLYCGAGGVGGGGWDWEEPEGSSAVLGTRDIRWSLSFFCLSICFTAVTTAAAIFCWSENFAQRGYAGLLVDLCYVLLGSCTAPRAVHF